MLNVKLRSIFFFFFLSCLINTRQSNIIKILEEKIIRKEGSTKVICSQPIVRSKSLIQLGQCGQNYYIMPLLIGTPPQTINTVVSTLDSFLGLIVQNSQSPDFNINQSYTSQVIGTLNQVNALNYVFKVNGVSDLIQINSNISIRNEMLLVDSSKNIEWFAGQSNIVGVLGLGQLTNNSNILYNAFQNGQLQSAMFTLSLANSLSPILYYNQIPQEIINNSNFVPIIDSNSYELNIIQFEANGIPVSQANGAPKKALIDSTTKYFTVSQNFYSFIIKNYFQSCLQKDNLLCESCQAMNSLPTFTITFQQVDIYLTPEQYMSVLPNGSCRLNFHLNQDTNSSIIILGSSIFSKYNVTFDPVGKRIGFQANQQEIIQIDFTFFEVSLWIILVFIIIIFILAIIMLWKFRVIKNQNYSRLAQISLSSRFLDKS